MKLNKYYILLAVFSLIYIFISFATPLDPKALAKYNLSEFQSRLISVSIVLPLISLWVLTFYGFIRFRAYSNLIKNQPEGKGFSNLSTGLGVWAWSFPITAIISAVFAYLIADTKINGSSSILGSVLPLETLNPLTTIISKYLAVVVAVSAFYFVSLGAKQLAQSIQIKTNPFLKYAQIIFFLAISAIFAYTVLTNPNRQVPVSPDARAAYYLPDWLIIISIILPLLYAWYIGLGAAVDLKEYRRNVSGIIYKNSLGFLALGIISVVISSILLQLLTSVSSVFAGLNISSILVFIYMLLAVIGAGYVFIAIGASKLKKIEEI